jgi:hypothetical protein
MNSISISTTNIYECVALYTLVSSLLPSLQEGSADGTGAGISIRRQPHVPHS